MVVTNSPLPHQLSDTLTTLIDAARSVLIRHSVGTEHAELFRTNDLQEYAHEITTIISEFDPHYCPPPTSEVIALYTDNATGIPPQLEYFKWINKKHVP
jgi:hypothetical protein